MDIEFRQPWTSVGDYGSNLSDQLERELAEGHPLWRKRTRAIAQRTDSDDVLFVVEEEGEALLYAVVHLTWSGEPERDTRWPDTETYSSIEEWACDRMNPDHEEFMTN